MAEAVAASPLPGRAGSWSLCDGLLFACGCVDRQVRLFTAEAGPGGDLELRLLCCLAAHRDWVRSLAFSHAPIVSATAADALAAAGPEGLRADLLQGPRQLALATADQEGRVRLWRIEEERGGEADRDQSAPATHRDAVAAELGLTGSLASVLPRELQVGGLNRPESFAAAARHFSVAMETLIFAHEGRVNAVAWAPPVVKRVPGGVVSVQPPVLWTCSLDKTLLCWSPQTDQALPSTTNVSVLVCASAASPVGVWGRCSRLGSTSQGRPFGLFGCAVSPSGERLAATNFNGALLNWRRRHLAGEGDGAAAAAAAEVAAGPTRALVTALWSMQAAVGGHVGAITDMSWGWQGKFLLTCGTDKTTRAWVRRPGAAAGSWVEAGRPQAHGHAINCIAVLHGSGDDFQLVSGGDEKILRVLSAPWQFVRSLAGLTDCEAALTRPGRRADRVYVPELGLSTKPVTLAVAAAAAGADLDWSRDEHERTAADASHRASVVTAETADEKLKQEMAFTQRAREQKRQLAEAGAGMIRAAQAPSPDKAPAPDASAASAPPGAAVGPVSIGPAPDLTPDGVAPDELVLQDHTLWLERDKLYGHGNELVCTAAHPSRALVASASKARDAAAARIRIWAPVDAWAGAAASVSSDGTFTEVQALPESHASTVVRLCWGGAGDRFLLSVSKDRHFGLHRLASGAGAAGPVELLACIKAHKRIIWDAAFCPAQVLPLGVTVFATGSRDKTVKFWRLDEVAQEEGEEGEAAPRLREWGALPTAKTAITALDFCRGPQGSVLLAVGEESGCVSLWQCAPAAEGRWEWAAAGRTQLPSAVTRLCWRPQQGGPERLLAVACETGCLQVLAIP